MARPTAEQRLALLSARGQLGSDLSREEECVEILDIASELPDHPEVLYELSHCTDDDVESISLLQRALEIDPENRNALRFLTLKVWHTGDFYGMEAASLIGHGTALYETSKIVGDKLVAAKRVFAIAVDAGDREAAAAIRDRARRDLGLDALDFGPERRAGSLRRACGGLLYLDLEEICLSAVEQLADEAAAAGEPIPSDVLWHMERVLPRLKHGIWRTGPKTAAAARLNVVLTTYPESLRSSEHHRVLAKIAPAWAERIEGLRRAVDADRGNVRAKCDLADGLALTGAREEAVALYRELAASPADRPPCDPEEALVHLEEQSLHGAGPLHAPEDPVEFMILN